MHVCEWAESNKLKLNVSKTKKTVFKRRNARNIVIPPPLTGIDITEHAKLLGIVIDECLAFSHQTDLLLQICNQRLHLIKNFCIQGLSKECFNRVFHAIVLGRLTYAIQAWNSYLSQYEIDRVNKFLCKAHRWGLTTVKYDYGDLLYEQDVKLFRACQQRGHCLSHQLTIKAKYTMSYGQEVVHLSFRALHIKLPVFHLLIVVYTILSSILLCW